MLLSSFLFGCTKVSSTTTTMWLWIVCVFMIVRFLRRRRLPAGFVGFLHPDAFGGGGGERVLWVAIRALLDAKGAPFENATFILYTKRPPRVDGLGEAAALLAIVKKQFDIAIPIQRLRIVFLDDWFMSFVDAQKYPRLTLFLQSVCGGFATYVACAILNRPPELFIETVGIPFVYPFLWLSGVRSAAYVHYPVVSTDMIRRVAHREEQFNNAASVAKSPVLSAAKLWYYRAFALLYRFVGWFPTKVFTNSTWTNNHIQSLWCRDTEILYPPCNTRSLSCSTPSKEREPWIISVGQFRPEKNHALQVRAFAEARKSPKFPSNAKLLLCGGCRNAEDRARISLLEALIASLDMKQHIELCVSIPFLELREKIQKSVVGLHTMRDEHFGIVVVEYLAAGCIPLAHNSGGVKADIVTGPFGRLATTQEEYTNAMIEIMEMLTTAPETLLRMQRDGIQHALSFSDEQFAEHLLRSARDLFL